MSLTRQEAASELLRRRRIRENLVLWAEHFGADKGWKPALHHRFLLEKLQAITDGTLKHSKTGLPCRKLMILMPPGAAKSTYTSVTFPTWFLSRWKEVHNEIPRILSCSYSSDLIEAFSRECRNGVDAHHGILGYTLLPDSRAIQEWSISNGGTYRCAGVGAGIAGRRADAGVIDDYLGSQEDADSKIMREKQAAWYFNDFWPRLKPLAIQIIIANRRHEEDLVGVLLAKQEDEWEVISFPFFAEEDDILGRKPGERLWPEWFTEQQAEEVKRLPARTIACLYQQRPAPEEGDYFKTSWLLPYSRDQYDALMRQNPKIYAAGDWAVSEAKGSNATCLGGAVLDSDGIIYILPDLFWKVAGPKEVTTAFLEFLKRRNPLVFRSEKGHISQAWGPFFKDMMLKEGVHNYIKEVTVSRDKEVRSQSIRGQMSMGRVRFPVFANWWPAALHELLMFPGGKTDDFVDFLAHIGMEVMSMVRPVIQKGDGPEDWESGAPRLTMGWVKKSDKENRRSRVKYAGR
jgi:hypothetical protein